LPSAGEKKPEFKDTGGQLPVSPTFELPEIIREFEREKPSMVEGLEESAQRWREFRREGKTMWGSEKWMKEPSTTKSSIRLSWQRNASATASSPTPSGRISSLGSESSP
jgi:hypothetical protein